MPLHILIAHFSYSWLIIMSSPTTLKVTAIIHRQYHTTVPFCSILIGQKMLIIESMTAVVPAEKQIMCLC